MERETDRETEIERGISWVRYIYNTNIDYREVLREKQIETDRVRNKKKERKTG